MLLFLVGIGLAVVRYLQSPEGKKMATFFGESAKLVKEAAAAPGTVELRRDAGCAQAFVFDMDRMQALFDSLSDAGTTFPAGTKRSVMCQAAKSPPSCDDVASTYVRAVSDQPGPFHVEVTKKDGTTTCRGSYAADGTRIP